MDEATRILIAEDNTDHAELSKSILQKNFHCTVDVTPDGKSCLALLRTRRFDILLLDYILPDCNGLTILNEISKLKSNIAIIMITGQGDEKVAVEAMKAGAYDYITKSTGYLTTLPLIIRKAIETHLLTLEQQRMKDQLFEQNKTLSILYQISSTLNKSKPFPELINDSLSKILKLMKLDYGAIYLSENLTGNLADVFCQGFEPAIRDHLKQHLLGDSFIKFFTQGQKRPVTLNDIIPCSTMFESELNADFRHIYIYRLALKRKNMGFFITGGRALTETDQNIFDSLLNQIVVVIERNLLLIQEKNARELSDNLRAISEIINSSTDIDDVLNSVLNKIITYVNATCGAIFIFKADSNSFEAVYHYCLPAPVLSRLKKLNKIQKMHFGNNHLSVNPDRRDAVQKHPRKGALQSFISIPIRSKNEIIGIIDLGCDRENAFSDNDAPLLKAISDQVSTAIAKARLFQQVRQLKEFNENIVQNLEEGILIENDKGDITFANPRMEKLVNRSQDNLQFKQMMDLVKEDYHEILQYNKKLLLKKQPCRFEAALVRDGHEEIVVQISCHPLFEGETYCGALAVFVDITETKKLESLLIQSEKLSALGQLISGVAHELNNPLAGIMGMSKLLIQEIGVKKFRDDLEIIQREAYRCHKIVDNLLTFARKHAPEKTWTNIHDVINSVLELRLFQFKKDNIGIDKEFAPGIPRLYVDFHQLQQVFLNILTNAHHELMEKTGERRITIRTKAEHGKAIISISDNGRGIPSSIVTKIFDPFFTTKDPGKGTGLGLSICSGIIDNHDGKITVENLPDSGACFHLELPIHRKLKAANQQTSQEDDSPVPTKRILVIDDEPVIIEILHRYLSREGHVVDVAPNGASALKQMKNNQYEVIISDMKMPGISGEILYDLIGKTAPNLQQRMIFTTGDADSEEVIRFLSTHQCNCLSKPFSFEELKEAISNVCL
ncbi:MAG: response regulator [Candidatus Zhuqueibacterota bacterium]